MAPHEERASAGPNRVTWWASCILICAYFCIRYVWGSAQYFSLKDYAGGRLPMPFQGRVLMAGVLHATAGNPTGSYEISRLSAHMPSGYGDTFLMVLGLSHFVSLVVVLICTRASLTLLTGDAKFSAWASLLAIYMASFNLMYFGLSYALPYDLPSLALFSLCVYLILSQRYAWLLLAFAVSTLNRETSVFLVLFLGLYTWFQAADRTRFRRATPWIGAMAVVWLLLRVWVGHHFRFNPETAGARHGAFVVQLLPNLKALVKLQQWPLYFSVCGFLLPALWAGRRWVQNDPLQRSVGAIVALWIAAMLVVGTIVEIRIFTELAAFAVLPLGLIVYHRWVKPADAALYAAE